MLDHGGHRGIILVLAEINFSLDFLTARRAHVSSTIKRKLARLNGLIENLPLEVRGHLFSMSFESLSVFAHALGIFRAQLLLDRGYSLRC